MKKQTLLIKVFSAGIILLLISNIIPSVNADKISIKETTIKEMILINDENNINPLNLQDPKLVYSGTKGENNWYITNVGIDFNYIPDHVKEIWYKIMSGNWQKYNDNSISISTEGKTNFFWYWIDEVGWQHNQTPVTIKIDKTPPTIKLTKISGSNDEIKFTADCNDKTSEMDHVDFYLDDVFQASDNTSPYQWTWTGTEQHNVYAKAYDMAGLEKQSDTVKTPRILSNYFQFINDIILRFIYNIWF